MTNPTNNPALAALRHHVTGAIERGEATPIVNIPPVETFDIDWDAWTPSLGAYESEGPATEWFDRAGMEWQPASYGSVPDMGWYAQVFDVDAEALAMMPRVVREDVGELAVGAILHTSDSGFRSLATYSDPAEFAAAVADLEAAEAAYYDSDDTEDTDNA